MSGSSTGLASHWTRARTWLVPLVILGACTLDTEGAGSGDLDASVSGSGGTFNPVGGSSGAGGTTSGGAAGTGAAGTGAVSGSAGNTSGGAASGGSAGTSQGCFPGPDEKRCGDLCVKIDDPEFGCGNATCSPCTLSNAEAVCLGDVCAISTCSPGFEDCDGDPATGCELNTDLDPRHCGSCTNDCFAMGTVGENWECQAGMCRISQCPAGRGDCDGDESNGCETDLNTDSQNCSFCSNACNLANAASSCSAGECVIDSCNGDFADCDGDDSTGCEANLDENVNHCGACDRGCSDAFVDEKRCSNGVCTSTCTGSRGNCGRPGAPAADDGCEINTRNDTNHCGGCGDACSTNNSDSQQCANSVCTHTCANNRGDCNGPRPGATDDGCEANLTNNENHCGSCGDACSTTGSNSQQCSGGECTHTCANNRGDCNGPRPGASDDGCETNLATNENHCGGCGDACSTNNSTDQQCSGGQCIHTCANNRGDCNGPLSGASDDGCEVNFSNNENHCGACGDSCSTNNSEDQSCSGGECVHTCSSGFDDCNGGRPGATDDGCEINVDNDDNNCGSCTNTCGGSQSCMGGMCMGGGVGGTGGTSGTGGTGGT